MFDKYTNYNQPATGLTHKLPAKQYEKLIGDFNHLISVMTNKDTDEDINTIRNNTIINSFISDINTYVRIDTGDIANRITTDNRTKLNSYPNNLKIFVRPNKRIEDTAQATIRLGELGIVPINLFDNIMEPENIYLLRYLDGVFELIIVEQLGTGDVEVSIDSLKDMLDVMTALLDAYIEDKPIPEELTQGFLEVEEAGDIFKPITDEYFSINDVPNKAYAMSKLHEIYPENKPKQQEINDRLEAILAGNNLEDLIVLRGILDTHTKGIENFYRDYVAPLEPFYVGSQIRYQEFLDRYDVYYSSINQTKIDKRILELREFEDMLNHTMNNYGPKLVEDEIALTGFKNRLLAQTLFVFEDVDDLQYKAPVRLLPEVDVNVSNGFQLITNFAINNPNLYNQNDDMKDVLPNTPLYVSRLEILEQSIRDKYSVYNTELSQSQSEALQTQQNIVDRDKDRVTELFNTFQSEGYTKDYLTTMHMVTEDIIETRNYFSIIEQKAKEYDLAYEYVTEATRKKLLAEKMIEDFQPPIDLFEEKYLIFKTLYDDMIAKQVEDLRLINEHGSSLIGDDNLNRVDDVIETCYSFDTTDRDQIRTRMTQSIEFANNLISSLPYINLTSNLNGPIVAGVSKGGDDFGGEFDDFFSGGDSFVFGYPKMNGLIVDGMITTNVSCYTVMRTVGSGDGDLSGDGGGGVTVDKLRGESNEDGSAIGLDGVDSIDFRTVNTYIVENMNRLIMGKGNGDKNVTEITNGIALQKEMLMVPILDDGLHLLCYNTVCMEFIVCKKHDKMYIPLIAMNLTEFGLPETATPTSFNYGDGTLTMKVKEHSIIFIKNTFGELRAISSSPNADVVGFRGITVVMDGIRFYGVGMDSNNKILEYARLLIPKDLLLRNTLSPYVRVPETHSHLIRSRIGGKTVTNLALIYVIEQTKDMLDRTYP